MSNCVALRRHENNSVKSGTQGVHVHNNWHHSKHETPSRFWWFMGEHFSHYYYSHHHDRFYWQQLRHTSTTSLRLKESLFCLWKAQSELVLSSLKGRPSLWTIEAFQGFHPNREHNTSIDRWYSIHGMADYVVEVKRLEDHSRWNVRFQKSKTERKSFLNGFYYTCDHWIWIRIRLRASVESTVLKFSSFSPSLFCGRSEMDQRSFVLFLVSAPSKAQRTIHSSWINKVYY